MKNQITRRILQTNQKRVNKMKKPLEKLSVILAIASALSLNLPVNAANKETEGIVRGSYINLRAEPKFNSQIVGKKLRGDTYTIKFEQQNWLKVIFKDNTEGWIYKTLIEATNKDAEENKVNLDDKVPEKKEEVNSEVVSKADKANDNSKKQSAEANKPAKSALQSEKPLVKPVDKKNIPDVVEESGTAEELYNQAIKLYEKRKYSEALDKNKAASKKAPKNAEIINNIGNCQFKLGRIEDALESWKEALKIAPRSGKICNNLGIAYYQLDKNKDAIEYYKKAILFESDFADPYYNLASVYGFIGDFDDALMYYKKFLEFNPDDTMKKLADERIAYCEKQLSKKLNK